ncbi:hypothetical protein ES708_27605 [subsurface metagenome]
MEIAFEDNKGDEAIEILKEIKGKGTKDIEIIDFITELMQENKDAKQNLVNIINLIARSKKELGLDIQSTFSEKVVEVITNNLLKHLYSLTLDFVFFVIRKSRPALRKSIISNYIGILGLAKDTKIVKQIPKYSEFVLDLFGCIINNRDLFVQKMTEVTTTLTNAHFDNIDVLILFGKNEKAIEDFISSELLIKLIGSITDSDFITKHSAGKNLFNIKLNFLLKCKKVINTTIVEAVLEKLNSLLTAQNQASETPEKKGAITQIVEKTESTLKEFSTQVKDSQKADTFTSTFVQSSTNTSDFSQKSLFLPVFFYLSNIAGANGKTSIKQQIQSFVKGTDISTIESFFKSKDGKFQQDFFQVIKADIEERAVQDKKFLDFIWRFEDDDNRNVMLGKLINSSNYVFALTKLDEENYKTSDKKGIVNLLLIKTQSLSPVEKAPIYGIVNKMECAKDKDLREKYTAQLKDMIINQNTASQEIAFSAYKGALDFLPHLAKLPFTVDIIDWLNKLDPVNINHKFALKIALLYWDQISATYKDNLMTILFDRIIAKTTLVDEINMAFLIGVSCSASALLSVMSKCALYLL